MDPAAHEPAIRPAQPDPDTARRPASPARPALAQTLGSEAKTTDNRTPPEATAGVVVGVIGGLVAVGGTIFLLYQCNEPTNLTRLVVGVVLVFGGLLLRIESAIRGAGRRGRS
jgi:hypothetical protein